MYVQKEFLVVVQLLFQLSTHHFHQQRETEEVVDGQCQEDLKEQNIDLTRIGEASRNREVWRSLVRASLSAR